MNNKEISEIVKALKDDRQHDKDKDKWVDWLFKALIGLLVYFGLEMKKDVSVIKSDTSDLKQTVMLNQQSINNLKGVTNRPTFTEGDYVQRTQPIINSVNKNSIQIEELNAKTQKIQERVLELEFISKEQTKTIN